MSPRFVLSSPAPPPFNQSIVRITESRFPTPTSLHTAHPAAAVCFGICRQDKRPKNASPTPRSALGRGGLAQQMLALGQHIGVWFGGALWARWQSSQGRCCCSSSDDHIVVLPFIMWQAQGQAAAAAARRGARQGHARQARQQLGRQAPGKGQGNGRGSKKRTKSLPPMQLPCGCPGFFVLFFLLLPAHM